MTPLPPDIPGSTGSGWIRLDRHEFVRALATVACGLVIVSIVVNALKGLTGDHEVLGLAGLFDLKSEGNIPTFYAGCLHLLDALLLAVVWMTRRHRTRRGGTWLALAAVFVFLSADELLEIHELLTDPIEARFGTSGLLHNAWVIAYGGAVLVVGAVFLPVWWRLPSSIKWWMALAAGTFLAGAIGAEMIGGAIYEDTGSTGGPLYAMAYTVEEALELAGLIIFAYALLALLRLTDGGVTVHLPGLDQTGDGPA